MSSFKYHVDGKAEEIKLKLIDILAQEIKKPYVKTNWNNHELSICIEKMGTSEIKIQLKEQEGKCTIQEAKRSIAFMHKAFIGEVEKIVDNILINRLGAKKA